MDLDLQQRIVAKQTQNTCAHEDLKTATIYLIVRKITQTAYWENQTAMIIFLFLTKKL